MTPGRLREIARMAKSAPPAKLHDLYIEVYGADFAGQVTIERARVSIREACAQLLDRKGAMLPDTEPAQSCTVPTVHAGLAQEGVPSHSEGCDKKALPARQRKPLVLRPLRK